MNPASWEILYKVTCHLLCIKHFTHQLVIKMNKIISHFLHFWVVFLRICLTSFDKKLHVGRFHQLHFELC